MRLVTKKQKEDHRNSSIESLKKNDDFQIRHVYDIIIVTYVKKFKEQIRPCLQIWKKNAAHPFINFYYIKPELRERAIDKYIGLAEDRVSRKIKEQNERKNFKHSIKIGDILHSSWGYEQTNCDFYQVIDVMNSFVKVQRIDSKEIPGTQGFMSEQRIPVKNEFFNEKPLRRKVLIHNSIRINSYTYAYLWDGKDCYCSWYA